MNIQHPKVQAEEEEAEVERTPAPREPTRGRISPVPTKPAPTLPKEAPVQELEKGEDGDKAEKEAEEAAEAEAEVEEAAAVGEEGSVAIGSVTHTDAQPPVALGTMGLPKFHSSNLTFQRRYLRFGDK